MAKNIFFFFFFFLLFLSLFQIFSLSSMVVKGIVPIMGVVVMSFVASYGRCCDEFCGRLGWVVMMGFVGFGCEWFCLDCAFYVVDFVANCGCGCGCDGFCGFFFLLPVVVVSGLQVVGSCL